ncbi:MAG: hypothetical protein JWM62_3213 [Frankiales bacterium]|jgi:hypothetical protein|nr:hypothetical protein [Frankiales bacterium]
MSSQPVGSAAEEAARLFQAAEQWMRTRAGGHLDGLATGAPECTVCPVCQGIAAVRGVRPETVEHLLDAAASFVAALKTTVTGAGETDPARRPDVQHIDVRED